MKIGVGIGPTFGGAAGAAPSWLLRDEFNTDAAAPLASPRTAEPGPGTLTLVQTDGQFSVSGGKLINTPQATPVWGDLGFYGPGFARLAGRTVMATASTTDLTKHGPIFGWRQSGITANDNTSECFYVRGGALTKAYRFGIEVDLFQHAINTDYQLAVVLRSAGVFLFIKGGAFASWTLLWIDANDATATMFPFATILDATNTIDSLRVIDLPAPFNSDYGLATQRLAGAVAAGTAFVHTANCLIEWTQTTLPAASARIRFRYQDENNHWLAILDSAGVFYLYEVVAGIATLRASAAGTAAGHRIVVIADGTTIRGYSNNVLRWTYSSASNFATLTSGNRSNLGDENGTISDLVAWPRTVTLPYGL